MEEEVYTLPDGSQIDLSNHSQFEKTNFLIKNPKAKKQFGVAKSAVATSKKKIAQEDDLGLFSTTGSLESKKWRLPTVTELQEKGEAPPPSASANPNLIDLNGIYNTVGNTGNKVNKQSFKIPNDKGQKEQQVNGRFTVGEDVVNDLIDSVDNPGNIKNERRDLKYDKDVIKNKIQLTDSDLTHPHLYYSSNKQGIQDNFIDENYDSKELQNIGVNVEDFDGFLNKTGYKNDFLNKESLGVFNGEGKGLSGYDIGLAKEVAKKKLLNAYMENMQQRDFTKQNLNQDYEIASGVREKKDIINNQIFDQNGITKYVEKNYPILTQRLKERDSENRKIYDKDKQGGSDFFSWETPGKIAKAGWNAVIDRTSQLSSTVYNSIGLDEAAEGVRMLDEENKMLRPIDRNINYVSGKTTSYNGTDYIVDNKGEIYDKDHKIRVTDLFDESAYKKIVKDSEHGTSDWMFSVQGSAVQTSGVMADMLMQAAVTHGVGELGVIGSEARLAMMGAKPTSKFTSILNDSSELLRKIPLKRDVGYSMIAQGALGYSQGYEETLKAARDAGVNDKQAFKLAALNAQRMAVLYSTTGEISPQVDVAKNIFGSKNIIKKAMQQYLKTGEKGFVNYIDNVIRNTPKNLIEFAEHGGAEVVQENLQQFGENSVNHITNVEAGKQLKNDTMTGDDFMNTSILSFISAGAMSKIKMPNFHTSDSSLDDLRSLSTLAKNKVEFEKVSKGLVDNKVFTADQVDKLKQDVDIYNNNINRLPKSVSADAAMPILRKLDEIRKLEDEKKQVAKAFHEDIDSKIDGINNEIKKIAYTDQLKIKNKAISDAIKKGVVKDIEMKSFSNDEDMVKYLNEELNIPIEIAKKYSKEGGFALDSDALKKYSKDPESISSKSQMIFMNESRTNDAGVMQHEFLHGLLQNTIKNNPEAQKLLGVSLGKELVKLQDELTKKGSNEKLMDNWFFERLGKYVNRTASEKAKSISQFEIDKKLANGNESKIAELKAEHEDHLERLDGVHWEEIMTLYSDALRLGHVTYNESIFTKIGDVIRRVLQHLGLKDIKFNSGKDVYNFIKDYNHSVENNSWGKAMKKMGEKGASINKEALSKEIGVKLKSEENTNKSEVEKFSLASDKKSSEQIKKDINSKYDKEKWSNGSVRGRDENPAIERVLYDILGEYDYIIKAKAKALGFANTPGYNSLDMISETQIELMPHIRNFNREFFQKREEYKKELIEKGLDPKSKEFQDKVDAHDEKGYQGKKGIVKENDDLNAWINSQLLNKMNAAMGSGNVAEEKFTEDIEGETFKESKIHDGFGGDEGYLMDEGEDVFENMQEHEVEQDKLAVLLRDPVFRFTDDEGNPVNIETIPFGANYISSASDPTVSANVKLKIETDPKKIAELKKEIEDLQRGLELESKKDLTYEEEQELKSLKSFKSFDLSMGNMVNTYKALSVEDSPAKIVTNEVADRILVSPNIQTLEYRNFKEKMSDMSKTMMKRITFEHGPGLESLMYKNWKLLYDVINHPVDPVTGESSYASKKLPPTLKEFDDKGNLRKISDITRVKFLQAYYDLEDATRIIKLYGGKNAEKELKQLEPREINPQTGKGLSQNAHFDRRTALRELFGDVMVLQEARRLIRTPEFLNRVAEKNVNLYNDLKDDVIRTKVLENMAKGKSDVVKFSLAEEENGKQSTFLSGLPFSQQWVVARDIDKAVNNAKMAVYAKNAETDRVIEELKNETDQNKIKELNDELLKINSGQVTFKVPDISGMTDKEAAYFIIQKAAAGYNNFEFMQGQKAETPLLKQVIDSLDFKSKEYQKILERNSNIEQTINDFIEANKGVASTETFSIETARNLGKNINRHELFLPPEDEDFLGLLYTLASAKGKEGEEQLKFMHDNLLKPYSDAMLNLMKARQVLYKDWQNLVNKKYKGISSLLKKDSGYGGYLTDQAVRVYLWKKAGYEIPGLDNKDMFHLLQIVRSNKQLRNFADDVSLISKQANGYSKPDSNWGFGSVVGDINNIISKSNREKFLEHWTQNVDKAFSKDNLSKIEVVYGRKYAKALRNTLERMKSGTNRTNGQSDALLNWLNAANSGVMFGNMRSAVLQTIGAVNYINTSDNNILKAGAALLNVPQYVKDFHTIWNSDYLKDRRSNLTSDVTEAEIAQVVNDPRNINILDKMKALNYYILKHGYGPTRLADSVAIALGGAGFYRNRLNTYLKQGNTQEEAERLTLRDLYQISEENQQSADVSKISMNQASTKGRLILAFLNTPFQYSRIIKRSVIDLAKGRGSAANNIAKIVYYGAVQNLIFNYLQNALFAMLFDDDEERKKSKFHSATVRTITGAMDTLLKGSGMQGVLLSTISHAILKIYEKKGNPKGFGDIALELSNFIPALGIKLRALSKAYNAVTYNTKEIKHKGFSIHNKPALEAVTSITTATTNFPADRIYQKTQNVANALDYDNETWKRIFYLMGYSEENLNPKAGRLKLKSNGEFKTESFEVEDFKPEKFQ